jgi:hypothetical protein
MIFTKSYEDDISSHGYRYFDFEIDGAKMYTFKTRDQSATDWKKNKSDRCIWTHKLMIVESGMKKRKMRNGYVKESSSELSVCFDAVHHIVLYLIDDKF